MYLLFDIGGTKMLLTFSENSKEFAKPYIIPTPKDFDEAMEEFKKFAYGKNIKAVVGGIASVLDREKNKLINPPNIKSWKGIALKKVLQDMFKTNVVVENDADLAGLGEAVYGQGKDCDIVAYLTISTGVGGTRIVNKRIDRSSLGFEPGHQIIQMDGEPCGCGGKGHLEAYISGSSVQRRFGKKPYDIHDAAFWDTMAKLLAYGVHNTIVHWSPDIVLLGGSMMKTVGISIERVRVHLASINTMFPHLPRVEKSAFGDDSGLYGGLALLGQKGY